ncbi:MAG TPA: oxygen-independent coproporphyrinogen III oxidase [Planctomycetota bacterium]
MSARLVVDEAQILRFSGPGPRYTSYPTVPAWTDAVGPAQAEQALRRAAATPDEPLSLYVHLPFCARLCLFCGCTVEITRRTDRVERYLAALEREIDQVAPLLGARRRVTQLHLGGGTPTHLTVAQLEHLHAVLARHFVFEPGAEISIEVHPHVTTPEQVDALVALGFRRFSMGVQDTDPHVQEVIHRDQTVEETAALVAHCRARGVESVNLDLLYGLPEQSEATFTRTLDDVAAMRPDRLAVYGYAHVPWLKPFQRALERHRLPGPAERARLFALAVERLADAGYELIGLDHFALPEDTLTRALHEGRLSRNFQGYTDQRAGEMVAFGMSAIGDVGGAFLQNARESADYERSVESGTLATVRGLVRSPEDDLRRAVILELMCRMRLDLDELGARLGRPDLPRHLAREWQRLAPLADEGLCRIEGQRLEVLPAGRLFLRHLAMVFDAYLKPAEPTTPRFSQTL